MIQPLELLGGLLLSAAIGLLAYRRGSLSGSGVVGAILSGTLYFGLGGWEWGVLLILFFVSSSMLSNYRADDKADLAEKFAKGHRRDLGQALANAGVGMALAVARIWWDHPLLFVACAGTMAAVNADTWATEVGVLSRRPPRLITNWRIAEAGTSGAVSALGMAVALVGAALIGLAGGAMTLVTGAGGRISLAVTVGGTLGGFIGALFDSLLGATVQAIYWCERCSKETERRVHRCGNRTRRLRGFPWLGNDGVNFLSSAVGAAVAVASGWPILLA